MANREVILYHAEWCGHCKTFMPTWEKLKAQFGSNIKFTAIEESSPDLPSDIKGFPTIIIFGQKYDGDRSYEVMESIIKSKLDGNNNVNGGKIPQQCGGARKQKNKIENKNDEYYKIKYFKYKAKYMKIRNEIGF